MDPSYEVQQDIHILPAHIPVPSIGLLPANAFLVKAQQPYLVDTGILPDGDAFMRALEQLIDPPDLRWIYLTHTDPDHIGALAALLDRAPRAKIVTTFVAIAKLQIGLRPLPPERIRICNPGERLDLGDRILTVGRPPVFDAPETTTVHDGKLDALFSADTFGGPVERPFALANDIPDERLEPSQLLWASLDSPWLYRVDRNLFLEHLREITDLDPAWIFSAHLPPARRMSQVLCRNLAKAPGAAPFLGPDQPAFEAMMRDLAANAPPAP